MLFRSVPLPWVIIMALAAIALGALGGYRTGVRTAERLGRESPQAETAAPAPRPSTGKRAPSDAEVEALLGAGEPGQRRGGLPLFGPGKMDPERQRRWEAMSAGQRQLFRQSFFAALSKVEGLEEVEDAIRSGGWTRNNSGSMPRRWRTAWNSTPDPWTPRRWRRK